MAPEPTAMKNSTMVYLVSFLDVVRPRGPGGVRETPTETGARSITAKLSRSDSTQDPAKLPYLEQVLPLSDVTATCG